MENTPKQRPLIGIVINEPDLDFYSKALYHVQKELFAHNADAAIFNTLLTQADQVDVENTIFSLIEPDLLDGMLVFGYTIKNEKAAAEIRRIIDHSNIPAVYIESEAEGLDSVMFDNDECTDKIVRHLTEWHHVKDVCFVSGPKDSVFHERVLKSFRKALAEQGIDLTDDRVFYGVDWISDYSSIADDIIDHGIPEAIVCCSDFTAAGLVGALFEKGLEIPEDVIVTGYSRNEPFASDYVNITSIERRPETMAVEAVRKLFAKIKGEEYVPEDKKPCCVLRKGITCGCERINYAELSRAAMDNMVSNRRSGFDSYYNDMSETLVNADSLDEYLWRIDWYTRYLGDFESFWLCINDGILHVPGDKLTDFSETVSIAYSRQNGKGAVPGGAIFNRHELLPAIFGERDKPCAYIFNCLHFRHVNYGYTVLSYGDSGAFFDKHYVMWLRYAAIAMEKQRRRILYNDSVSDDQIRDPLTGLLNIKGYKKVMTQKCGSFDRPDMLMRIISVDVENLRGINSAYGYSEGDRVLQRLATVLSISAGDDDICVRVSGDEFFICGLMEAAVPVDDVPVDLERNLEAFNSSSTMDFGVHFYTSRVTAPLTSVEILDSLPYEANYQRTMAKDNHNKKRMNIADGKVRQPVDGYDEEERKLVAKILNDDLLTYHFQPIVSAKSGEIVAYEALMRYEGGVKISPITILNHAAAMGRLDDVERHTMYNLFRFVHEHKEDMSDKQLYINSIPSCTLPEKDFEELCTTYSDIVSKIVIEFTEETEASKEQLEIVLDRRKRYGFSIAIDDYGTGYSNISNLLTFMPNCIKIDRSLIMNIHEDKRRQHFVKNIIDYARDNHFKVLAEGVEKIEELRMLTGMGIDLIQGYFTARPAPEPIKSIRTDIKEQIRECNRVNENFRIKKTYFAGGEDELSLISLDFDDYTEVFVSEGDCVLKGSEGYSSHLYIKIKDGLDCRLKLDGVHLSGENNEACIIVGKGSRLTLEITGTVELGGPISVPAGAWIDVVGDGTLIMRSGTTQSYGIGSDPLSEFGVIGVHLGGKLDITIDGEYCIGIGGGFASANSRIDVGSANINIRLAGKHLLCIGSIESDVPVTVKNSELMMSTHCVTGMGIGSTKGKLTAVIENSRLIYDASGDNISCINSPGGAHSTVKLRDTSLNFHMLGKNLIGMGSAQGILSIDAENCGFDIYGEGANAIGIGGMSSESKISLKKCVGDIRFSSSHGQVLCGAEGMVTLEDCDIRTGVNT
ncbi:EAL domain-containing protein [Ruminococcus albus]|uniref:Diguanylate cyclase (GGDEF) domain-containing protein n=1 Tax=Ruminococcus albus TaxID=1264 RepID=A0A1I1PDX2_RUMAL|nr:EAL domain-containing protein [Ruminococcus albus]SFD07999.1 diguanylate cyclase (GGDEF) domain-containing protein [Ruminococcus albus]